MNLPRLLPLCFIALIVTISLHAQPTPILHGESPRGFIENKGQFRITDPAQSGQLLFKFSSSDVDVYVTRAGLSYVFHRLKNAELKANRQLSSLTVARSKTSSDKMQELLHYEVERVDMTLKNADIKPENISLSYFAKAAMVNFYFNGTQAEHILPIEKISVLNVYPGIDWIIYLKDNGNDGQVVKTDFIVHAGADTRQIRPIYSRNVSMNSDSNGTVEIKGRLAKFSERKLFAYEMASRSQVPVTIRLHGNSVTYHFSENIAKKDIVLDPELFWGTYLTSNTYGIDYNDIVASNDLATDAAGNIIVQVSVSSGVPFPTLNPGNGAYFQDVTSSPNGGMVLLKFNKLGVLLWATFFGTETGGMRITVDANNNIIATGVANTLGLPLLDVGGYYSATPAYSFIARFSAAGQLQWSSYLFQQDWIATDMKSDASGNFYICGSSSFSSLPIVNPGGAYMNKMNYVLRPFVMKFSPACKLLWSTQIDGHDEYTGPARMAIDNNNNLVLDVDSIMRFNAALQLVTTFGPSGADLVVDNQGNLFVVGGGANPYQFPFVDPGAGAFIDKSPFSGKSTGFIMKYNSSNQVVWSTTLIQEEQDFMERIVLDKICDAVHVLGVMNDGSYDYPTVDNSCTGDFYFPAGSSPIGTGPVFFTFKTSGQQVYTSLTDFPYEYWDEGIGFAADPFGGLIYLFGHMRNFNSISAVKDPGAGAFFQPDRNNLMNASFMMKLNPTHLQANIQVTSPTGCGCTGAASVNVTCGFSPYNYLWSNGATSSSVANLCAGNYSVQVTDNNCEDTVIHFTISPGPGSIVSADINHTASHCAQSDGTITISSVTGGSMPYAYSIDNAIYQNTPSFIAVSKGIHTVNVKDKFGCPFTDSVLINDIPGPDTLYLSLLPSACNLDNGIALIDSVGGGVAPFTYGIDGSALQPSGLFNGLKSGSHIIQISDSAGCSIMRNMSIAQTSPPSSLTDTTTSAHCNQPDGSIIITSVTGGSAPYSYSIDGTSFRTVARFDSLSPQAYYLYIQDVRGCEYMDSAIVHESPGPQSISFLVEDALCDAPYGSVTATVFGGSAPYTYSMDSVNFKQSNLFAQLLPGSYTIYAKDGFGCSVSGQLSVAATHMSPVIISPNDSTVCYGQNVFFTAFVTDSVTSASFVWDSIADSANSFSKAFYQSGDLVVAMKNKSGCVSYDTAIITVKNCDSAMDYCVIFPNAFSPNHDGINELFGPTSHCAVANYRLMIFNRYGELVFSTSNIGEKWDGSFNGVTLDIGGYVYSCTYQVGSDTKKLKGIVILAR